MKIKSYSALFSGLLLAALAFPAAAAVPPGNGAATYDIMQHSSCCYTGDPILATESLWHAFFEAPGTPAIAPGVSLTETTDLTTLTSYDMLYIAQASIDALSGADMTTILNWVNAGGTLVINNHEGSTPGASAFGSFVGAAYAFTAVGQPDGNNMVVTDATNTLVTTPNVLDTVDLSGWGSSVHGAFGSLGAAYTCAVNSDDGTTSAPVLCNAASGLGVIILTGFDPECGSGCHDDHLDVPPGTNSGSELWENFILAGAPATIGPVPTLSTWTLGLLVGVLMLGGVVSLRRGARRAS